MAGFDVHVGRPGELALHAFSRDDYRQMGEIGILGERTELIEGVVYDMSPAGPRHFAIITRIDRLFQVAFGERFIVSVQMPVVISSRSEPMPDVAVLEYRQDFYESGLPEPKDVKLLVEVSDSTLAHDRAKAALYAKAGIVEYWLVDVRAGEVLVHRVPQEGRYTKVERRGRGETVEPGFGGGFAVSDFL